MLTGLIAGFPLIKFLTTQNAEQKRSFLYQATFNNYSFLPLAIIMKLYGDKEIAALIFSTLGAEIAVWTIGVNLLDKKGHFLSKEKLRHLLSLPLVSIYAAIGVLFVLHFTGLKIHDLTQDFFVAKIFFDAIGQLGDATIPVTLIVAGGRMATINWTTLKDKTVWLLTSFRLIIIPALAVLLVSVLFPENAYIKIMFIVAVMPVSVNSLVLGELYGGDQQFIGGTVLITHLISLFTIPLWLMFLI
jgi:predicted permease